MKQLILASEENQQVAKSIVDSNLAEMWQNWLQYAGVSQKSQSTYAASLRQLMKYFKENEITQPTEKDLANWRAELIEGGKAASTINLYVCSAKLFFGWLETENLYRNIAARFKSGVKMSNIHHKDALSVSQAKQLQRAVEGKGLMALRNRAIIKLMLTTGVRTIEVVRADICDIRRIEGSYYLFVQGKGYSDKSRAVLLDEKVYDAICLYLKARGKTCKNEPLFVSTSRRNKNRRLDTQTLRKMIKSNLRKINVDTPTITAHSLRHTAATVMIKRGVKIYDVQMVLGHKSISTTMIYNNAVNRMTNRAEISASKVMLI